MKLKYYLRGLGIGIIVTTVILAVSFSKKEIKMSDEEIMARAAGLAWSCRRRRQQSRAIRAGSGRHGHRSEDGGCDRADGIQLLEERTAAEETAQNTEAG